MQTAFAKLFGNCRTGALRINSVVVLLSQDDSSGPEPEETPLRAALPPHSAVAGLESIHESEVESLELGGHLCVCVSQAAVTREFDFDPVLPGELPPNLAATCTCAHRLCRGLSHICALLCVPEQFQF